MNKIAYRYTSARKLLGLSQRKIAKKAKVSASLVAQIESGQLNNPNWTYTKYLVESGINYFYLIGLSDEIEGELIDTVSKSEYEVLQTAFEELQEKNENLEKQVSEMVSRSEFEEVLQENQTLQKVLKMLQIEADEDGNLKKKK